MRPNRPNRTACAPFVAAALGTSVWVPLGPGSPPQRPRHRLLDAAVALHALPECAASCTCPAAWTAPVLPTLPNAHVVGGRPRVADRTLGTLSMPVCSHGEATGPAWGTTHPLRNTRLLPLARPNRPNSSPCHPSCLGLGLAPARRSLQTRSPPAHTMRSPKASSRMPSLNRHRCR